MNKKFYVFIEKENGVITKVELPQDFDGSIANFIANLGEPLGCVYYVGSKA